MFRVPRSLCPALILVCIATFPARSAPQRGGGFGGGFGRGGGGFGRGGNDVPQPLGPSLQPVAGSSAELDAYRMLQEETDSGARLALCDEFLDAYPESEMRHLVLRTRWEILAEDGDAADVIPAAEAALDAEIDFFESRSEAIPNPQVIPAFRVFELAHYDAMTGFYQSLMSAHARLNEWDLAVDAGERAIESEGESWRSYGGIAAADSGEYQTASASHRAWMLATLRAMMATRESAHDADGVMAYARRVLDVDPEDLPTLITLAGTMAERPMASDQDTDDSMSAAEGYARHAIENLDRLLESPAGAGIAEAQRAALESRVHATLGMVLSRRKDYESAEGEYRLALDAVPNDPVTHFRLGVILASSGRAADSLPPLARAVALGASFPAARDTLERVYQAVHGSLDGLDAYIESEGQALR